MALLPCNLSDLCWINDLLNPLGPRISWADISSGFWPVRAEDWIDSENDIDLRLCPARWCDPTLPTGESFQRDKSVAVAPVSLLALVLKDMMQYLITGGGWVVLCLIVVVSSDEQCDVAAFNGRKCRSRGLPGGLGVYWGITYCLYTGRPWLYNFYYYYYLYYYLYLALSHIIESTLLLYISVLTQLRSI